MVHCLGLKQLEIIEKAAIGVKEDGIIEFVARGEEEIAAELKKHSTHTITDLGDKFIMPGFIDTHCHAPQYLFTGMSSNALKIDSKRHRSVFALFLTKSHSNSP